MLESQAFPVTERLCVMQVAQAERDASGRGEYEDWYGADLVAHLKANSSQMLPTRT